MAPINESNPPENRDTAVMSSKHLLCSYLMDGIDTVLTKLQFQKSPVKNDSILLISSLCCKMTHILEYRFLRQILVTTHQQNNARVQRFYQ